ncbi:transglutaminase family protein [Microlunatus speluncae]|uniref:transglutaminase family protein n=1 Tax=Microlunatus speluncae TaxID=2594267 RepID=UPI00126614D3|nr:transglutaminase family protein [Microlunatus speluncae]
MIIQADRPQSRRYRIRHETAFSYDDEVVASYNEVRMTPLSEDHQSTADTRIEVRPASTAYRYLDYWGTIVHAFDTSVLHRELRVVASSLVDTRIAFDDRTDRAGWDALGERSVRDAHAEWLIQTGRTEPDEELRALAAEVVRGRAPGDAARAASEFVHDKIEYVPGVTGVHSRIGDVWSERKGVCQDIAHLTITLLRLAGIPARYVSGYLHPLADAEIGETVTGQSHAWVEWWDGAWTAFDPTNAIPAGERHVVVGRGREYADVAPFKGLYSGSAASSLTVTVEIARLF